MPECCNAIAADEEAGAGYRCIGLMLQGSVMTLIAPGPKGQTALSVANKDLPQNHVTEHLTVPQIRHLTPRVRWKRC